VKTTLPALLLLLGVAVIAVADATSGIPMWLRLRADLADSSGRVAVLKRSTEALRVQIDALESQPFALERAIREDLELARPGEVVVRFDRASSGRGW
jgi:cell division protein FtsB